MRRFKYAVSVCSFFAACLFLFSCSSGLGESIDLTPPLLEITIPAHGTFVPKNFTLKGTATDNKKVQSVEIEYKYKKDGETISGKKMAILAGEKWHCDFSFDGDYEVEFEAFAYDSLKNGSDTSHQRVMLLIDSQNPEMDKMSIIRGDYVARLYPLERFTESGGFTELKDEPKNKDNFQNEQITLVVSLDDNYGIGNLSLDLYEVNPETKAETLIKKEIPIDLQEGEQENKYSPRFTIKEETLPSQILQGLHYIKPSLNVTDEAGNQAAKKEFGVFAWESEYNKPHVSFTSMQSDGQIRIQKDSPIIVTIFDDDKIKSCQYSEKLVKEDEFHDKDLVSISDYTFEKGSRDLSFEIDTKEFDLGAYYIVVKVEDESGRDDGKYFEEIPVNITNADAPIIIVDKPEENSAPALDANGNFEIKGKVIDNEENLDKIAIAWLPKGNDDIKVAEDFFKTYGFVADATSGTMKIYNLTATTTDKVSNKPTYEFSKKFNFFKDFLVSGKVHNENKVFMIATKDPTGNVVTKTFRMSKISSAPKFKIGYKNSDKVETPAENFMFTPLANRETTFTIEPYSESNLQITQFSVKGSDNGKDVFYSENSGKTCEIKFDEDEASLGKVYKYTLSATDQIGGTSNESLTIQFDQFGVLESITCDHDSQTAFVKGDTIRLQANFDFKVYVNGAPYIQLSGTNFKYKDGTEVPEENRRAAYTKGNNSNTLYFEYKVPENIECTNLKIGNIEKNGAILEGNISKDCTSGVNSKQYKIDSIAPYIKSMMPAADGVVNKVSKSAKINFTFNEPVTVESGTVIIQRTDGWYIPPVLSEDVFLKIYNEKADSAQKKTLCGTADLSSSEKYIENTLIPKGPYMQYTNGIKESGGKMVPDLTTKYVLAYDLNIGDTTGTVGKLRTVLESAGYHKAEIDYSRIKSNVNSLELEITDDDFIGGLVNGVEYKIILKNFSVRDEAYNYSTLSSNEKDFELDGTAYTFWVGPVATPVIRVNRTATNDREANPFTPATNDEQRKKGYGAAQTTFKIDCETPGATVMYGTDSKESTPITEEDILKLSKNDEQTTRIDDITSSVFAAINANNSVTISKGSSTVIAIGKKSKEIAEKIYIKAKATKNNMEDSAEGKEGAFKTVIHYYLNTTRLDWSLDRNNARTRNADIIKADDKIKTPLRIYGSQIPEGSSYTAGWPLTANGDKASDYQIAYTNGDKHFYWLSWQINDDFTLQTYATNFQDPANPNVTYGMYHYCKNKDYYTMLEYTN